MTELGPDYLTLRKFAEMRGMRTDKVAMQRLRRRLVKKQRHIERPFLIRTGEAPNDPIYTTIPLMREHCPEFFDKRSEAEAFLKKSIAHLEEAIREGKMRDSALAAKVRELKIEFSEHVKTPHPASTSTNG